MVTSKEAYRSLCSRENSIPLFCQHWWLDATAGAEHWDVAIEKKEEEIIAALPYVQRKKFGFVRLGQPPLTQFLGPWIKPLDSKTAGRLAYEKESMAALIQLLPEFDLYTQTWHCSRTNWLPFYWQGFEQTTRYTYRLPDLSDLDSIWDGLRSNIRGDIRKASDRYHLKVRSDLSIDDFLELNSKTFVRQGLRLPYSKSLVRGLDQACAERNSRMIFIAEDEQERHHAGVYIVWDKQCAYYLMGGGDPELRGSGATSLCLWEAIKFASSVTRSFDFEGSMVESLERFVRAFGATQTPYFLVTKISSRLLKLRRAIMDLARK